MPPKLVKDIKPLRVVSKGYKTQVDTPPPTARFPIDLERIVHSETIDPDEDHDANKKTQEEILVNTYWPDELSPDDFIDGKFGNMCVGGGNAYTLTKAVPLVDDVTGASSPCSAIGPFSEYRTEVGIQANDLRFRIKLDYRYVCPSRILWFSLLLSLPPK